MTDICLFAHYDRDDRLADHVLYYIMALQRTGFDVVVISATQLNYEDRGKLAAINAALVLRENIGLDFGSWAAGLSQLRDTSGRLKIEGRLLLANDSVFGPIGDLSEALDRLSNMPGDVHCMVETAQTIPHMQSWFLMFSPAAYRSPAFEAIFTQNFAAMSKADIIKAGEIGLSVTMRNAGLRFTALASNPPRGGIRRLMRANPTHFLWQSLIERDGVPFLKVELLRDNPDGVASVSNWPAIVRARAPALLPLIESYLEDVRDLSAQPWPTHRWRALSAEAFVVRDDRLARGGGRIAGYANLFAWRILLATLLTRRYLLGLFSR
jgi:lipopolysaccharide biosynthesis protein